MKAKSVSLIFLLMTLKSYAFYSSDPVKYQEQIKDHVTRIVEKRSPDIYFLGDDHQVDHTKLYTDLITEILNLDKKVNCFFLELPTNHTQSAVEKYMMTGDFSFIEKASAFVHSIYGSKENPIALKEKKKLMDIARDNNIKVYAIDKLPSRTTQLVVSDMANDFRRNPTEEKYKAYREFFVYHYGVVRNEFMASNMAFLFDQGACSGAVSLIGHSHLKNQGRIELYNKVALGLQLILDREYDLKFGKLNIQ